MDSIRQDLKFAFRSLVARPLYSCMVIATLALGLGANAAIFSILHALVLRSLPVSDPSSLFLVYRNQSSLQYPLFKHFEAHSTTLEGILAFRTEPWRFTSPVATERVIGALVSGSYFRVLGVTPAAGTLITDADDMVPGSGGSRGPVAVLSHGFWMRQFGGQPGVVGTTIVLNARPFTVIGVAPRGFTGTEIGRLPDVFAPMAMQPVLIGSLTAALTQPRNNWLRMIARVKPGIDVRQAELELTSLLQAYNEEIFRGDTVEDPARQAFMSQRITLLPGRAGLSSLRDQYAKPLLVLMAVMALVLAITCANLANLSLGRAVARQSEIAIRLGLGASRARLLAQPLAESLLLSAAGVTLGLLLARLGRDALLMYLPIDQRLDAPLDTNVLLFTIAIAVGAAGLFGLVPALQGTRLDIAPVLKGSETRPSARSPLRKGLVVLQVSMSLVIIVGAALFLRSLNALLHVDAGFARANVVMATLDVPGERAMDVYSQLLEDLRHLPGVESAALADSGPVGTTTGWNINVPGYVPRANEPRSSPWVSLISPGYFTTLSIPLLAGRDFERRDLDDRRNVMIVSETFARHYFGNENPVGRYVGLRPGVFDVEIVGVARDAKARGLRVEPLRMVYVPFRPGPWGSRAVVHLRTSGDVGSIAAALRDTVARFDRGLPVFDVRTVEQEIDRSLLRERLVATMTALFGGVALTLAAIGLYGVLSFAVTRRTREFGIRIAVGAGATSILTLVLREAAGVLAAGMVVGLIAAAALGRVVGSLLYAVEPFDLVSAALAVGVLTAVGFVAAWIPARRASRVDPIRALRSA
jgi:predicted permease